jgi:hypothetical protein
LIPDEVLGVDHKPLSYQGYGIICPIPEQNKLEGASCGKGGKEKCTGKIVTSGNSYLL